MPYIWTHIIYGDEIIKKINQTPKDKPLFHLGCQGPDFLFFYRFWPWLKSTPGTDLGDLFHTVDCGHALMDLIVKAKKERSLRDYVAGFITHHILDRTTHAYIHYHAGYKKYKHQRLESILDTLIAQKLRGIETWKTPVVSRINIGNELPEIIVKSLNELALKYYPRAAKQFNKKEYSQAYRDMKRFFSFTFDPKGIKNALTFGSISPFRFTQDIPKRDYFNSQKKTWFHSALPTEEHKESFWDLWEEALNEGTTILRKVYDYWTSNCGAEKLSLLIKNISYDNGKPCDLNLTNKISDPIV